MEHRRTKRVNYPVMVFVRNEGYECEINGGKAVKQGKWKKSVLIVLGVERE